MIIGFGYGYPPLEAQFQMRGFTLGEQAQTLEKVRMAILFLKNNGYISEEASTSAMKRLNQQVSKVYKRLDEETIAENKRIIKELENENETERRTVNPQ